ncbi:MAG TPA: glycosyltransferase family 39 protein [Thermoanaerobaculia bacterium]|nr:glycosyltransferase family 39 protein [Thermoanaerobaculia bacterium]
MKRTLAIPLSLLATAVAVRVGLIFRYRFDSDEPQHMHVAWGWAHGLAQYRDVFDNHMPLFHLLSSPLFAATGDDPRLLYAARLSMLPLFLAALFFVWRIARSLFDDTTAWWSTALAALVPPFFLGSLEYRTDDLWLVLWLAVIAVAVGNSSPVRKAAIGGLLLGGAFGVSMKSTLYVAVLLIALAATLALTMRRAPLPPGRLIAKCVAIAAATTAVIPLLIAGVFAAMGLWQPFVYGVFAHNSVPFVHAWHVLWFIPLYFTIRAIALRIARSDGDPSLVRRRLFTFLACGVYLALYASFAPMTNLETYLPWYPLAAVLATPLLMRRERWLPAIAAAMLPVIIVVAQPWRNAAEHSIVLVEEVLALTSPSETVMDLKGETVFRPRPFYFVLEAVTNLKLGVGVIRDTIADTLVQSRTYVVAGVELFPPAARRFVERYYVPWGAVHVAGAQLQPLRDGLGESFDIAVPGPYVVLGERGVVRATIDGCAVGRSGIVLAAGRHRVIAHERAERPVVVWSGTLRSLRFRSER